MVPHPAPRRPYGLVANDISSAEVDGRRDAGATFVIAIIGVGPRMSAFKPAKVTADFAIPIAYEEWRHKLVLYYLENGGKIRATGKGEGAKEKSSSYHSCTV